MKINPKFNVNIKRRFGVWQAMAEVDSVKYTASDASRTKCLEKLVAAMPKETEEQVKPKRSVLSFLRGK